MVKGIQHLSTPVFEGGEVQFHLWKLPSPALHVSVEVQLRGNGRPKWWKALWWCGSMPSPCFLSWCMMLCRPASVCRHVLGRFNSSLYPGAFNNKIQLLDALCCLVFLWGPPSPFVASWRARLCLCLRQQGLLISVKPWFSPSVSSKRRCYRKTKQINWGLVHLPKNTTWLLLPALWTTLNIRIKKKNHSLFFAGSRRETRGHACYQRQCLDGLQKHKQSFCTIW